jgi:hypothetical protein
MTTLKLGWTNPLTDAFGAHPLLGAVLDLNDGQTFTLISPDGLELPPPARTLVPAGNIRTQGERITRAVYRHNREAVARLILGPGASYAALVGSVRQLLLWLDAPPSVPFTVQYQPNNATQAVYLDVVGCGHDIPEDEEDWLRLQFEPLEVVFIARPGLRGDRVTLQNLCVNPGFGQGSGAAVLAFSNTFATANGYTTLAGSAPTVTANVLTLTNGSLIGFGPTVWSAINLWSVRWQFATSLVASFYLHRVDANNSLRVDVASTTVKLIQRVAGMDTTLATGTVAALTNGNFYWLQVTQFATVSGDPPYVAANLYADSSGAIGSLISGGTAAGPLPDANATVAVSGSCAFGCTGANLLIGGNFANVHTLALFGPGSWAATSSAGASPSPAPAATGPSAAAWDATTTYTAGPVNIPYAARLQAPPAGIWHAQWSQLPASQGKGAPVTPGGVYVAGMWVYAPGVSTTCVQRLLAAEYTSAGALLQTTVVASSTGALAAWTQLSGSWTLQAMTAYVALMLDVYDTVAGASANLSVWADNCQLNAGSTLLPYCELRFDQSPAQLVVSGLLGDLPAPCLVQLGTYLTSLAKGGFLSYAVGRRGSVSSAGLLVAGPVGYYGTTFTPQATPVLDAASYGGYYVKTTVNNTAGWNPRGLSPKTSDALGTYHVVQRFRSADATPTGVQVRAKTEQMLDAWWGSVNTLRALGTYYGPYVMPLLAANVWTVADVGQVAIPPFPLGALTDPSQTYEVPRGEWYGTTAGGAEGDASWLCLLPVDGSLLVGVINNPSNNPVAAITTSWLWAYLDGLLTNQAGSGPAYPGTPGWTYSIEGIAVPAPGHGGGGVGSQTTGPVNINAAADPYLVLDPTLTLSGQSGGINQLVAYVADNAGAVLPVYAELMYSPLYLYAR